MAGPLPHGSADQAVVGLGGQVFMRPNSQDAVREFRPYVDVAPAYGHGPSREDSTEQTPLTVGSPQQVIERHAGMREHVGDHQRQLLLMDHAGLPLATVLDQLEILGAEVVPQLREELATDRSAHVPDAPTHARLRAASTIGQDASSPPPRGREGPFDANAGRAAVTMVERAVAAGRRPDSVVSVTGPALTPQVGATRERGLHRHSSRAPVDRYRWMAARWTEG